MKTIPLVVIILAWASHLIAATERDVTVSGDWQVAEVHINQESTRAAQYRWNDPRLKGRLFSFGAKNIWTDAPEMVSCLTPHQEMASMRVNDVIGRSLAGYGYPLHQADSRAYGLNIDGAKDVQVFRIQCGTKYWHDDLGTTDGIRGAWIIFLNDNQLLMRWYDESLLVLNRNQKDMKPKPSFDCGRSTDETERIICESYELSAFDQSIAEAYRQVLKQARDTGDDVKRPTNEQLLWLTKRNACGSDRDCILKVLKNRLDELTAASLI